MSLKDFMQQLQEQDNEVVYSKPPEEAIQIIPPVKQDQDINVEKIRVIPPKEDVPKVIKFKLNLEQNTEKEEKLNEQVVVIPPKREKPEVVIPQKQVSKAVETPTKQSINTEVKKDSKSAIDISEELFIKSETPLDKKEIWFEYYDKALRSKKNNFITDKCKRGRFTINEENKFIVLSDYETYDKDVNEILNDSWF